MDNIDLIFANNSFYICLYMIDSPDVIFSYKAQVVRNRNHIIWSEMNRVPSKWIIANREVDCPNPLKLESSWPFGQCDRYIYQSQQTVILSKLSNQMGLMLFISRTTRLYQVCWLIRIAFHLLYKMPLLW